MCACCVHVCVGVSKEGQLDITLCFLVVCGKGTLKYVRTLSGW